MPEKSQGTGWQSYTTWKQKTRRWWPKTKSTYIYCCNSLNNAETIYCINSTNNRSSHVKNTLVTLFRNPLYAYTPSNYTSQLSQTCRTTKSYTSFFSQIWEKSNVHKSEVRLETLEEGPSKLYPERYTGRPRHTDIIISTQVTTKRRQRHLA